MWQSTSYTDTGKVRGHNEDAVLELQEQGLWVVADGMGGHSHGDFASQLVTNTLAGFTTSTLPGVSKRRLSTMLARCNQQLIEKAELDNADIIGCTVAALHARTTNVVCTWSGDSRIYRLREGSLKLLTRDHSQESVVEDRDRLTHPHSFMEPSAMLTGAIGGDHELALEHCWYNLRSGDTFLLCTDGLNKEVSDDELSQVLSASESGKQAVMNLVSMYESRGARDNVGMVWVNYSADE